MAEALVLWAKLHVENVPETVPCVEDSRDFDGDQPLTDIVALPDVADDFPCLGWRRLYKEEGERAKTTETHVSLGPIASRIRGNYLSYPG